MSQDKMIIVSPLFQMMAGMMASQTDKNLTNAQTEDICKDMNAEGVKKEKSSVRKSNKQKGKDSEVFAFKTKEEVALMIRTFDKHIETAASKEQLKIAKRNKLLFLIGINVGIRGSDLCTLKWCDFLDKDGTFKESYRFQPKKTRHSNNGTGKWVRLFYNKTVQRAVLDYIADYPIDNMNDYVFFSRKGDKPISRSSIGRIIKDTAAECNIKQNINSHSLRKTWAYHVWHDAEDKRKALVILQHIFNHSSQGMTMKYIGILDDDAKDVFDSLELGCDLIDDCGQDS